MKKRHKNDGQRRIVDDKKFENYQNTWDSGFEGMCDDPDWEKWCKMVKYANQGRDRGRITPLSGPPYNVNDPHDWSSGLDFPTPDANPSFFLQFAVVIKRFRNYLDWLNETATGLS